MRIVVSGTHASGKTTLISDFTERHPDYLVLPDPFEDLDEWVDVPDARLFGAQLRIATSRLLALSHEAHMIAERGPLDFLAYLEALERLQRPGRSSQILRTSFTLSVEAAKHIDLLVLLPLTSRDRIDVGEDEDPELREEMNDALLELADDSDLAGTAVIELSGDRHERLTLLEAALL